jgi:ABC-type anion transport system duplicated permease subunit
MWRDWSLADLLAAGLATIGVVLVLLGVAWLVTWFLARRD